MFFSSHQRRWYSRQQLFVHDMPEAVRSWLFDASSLTARLIRGCNGKFRVELISQRISRPTLDELEALSMNYGDTALVRQVRLYCGSTVVVYARTVIPLTTLSGAQRRYANIGTRPLGAMLFADRTMQRDDMTVSCLSPGDKLYRMTGEVTETIWGRRSVFRVSKKPLLVSEYFLPALLKNNQ